MDGSRYAMVYMRGDIRGGIKQSVSGGGYQPVSLPHAEESRHMEQQRRQSCGDGGGGVGRSA